MLFFELFPAFVAVVSIGVGLWLFLVERRARQNPAEPPPRRVTSRPSAPVGPGQADRACGVSAPDAR
jgi:hypothetical protein